MPCAAHLNVDSFPQDVQELIALFREPAPGQRVRAVPGAGLHVPIWILGSSLFGAQLAAELGPAIRIRVALRAGADDAGDRDLPKPLQQTSLMKNSLDRPYVMLGVNVVAADTDEEARRLFTSHQQIFLALRRGTLGPVPPPVDPDRFEAALTPLERMELQHVLGSAIVGSPDTVRRGLSDFLTRTERRRAHHRRADIRSCGASCIRDEYTGAPARPAHAHGHNRVAICLNEGRHRPRHGDFVPPDPLTRSLAGTPTPRSARVAHSLPLVRAVMRSL